MESRKVLYVISSATLHLDDTHSGEHRDERSFL